MTTVTTESSKSIDVNSWNQWAKYVLLTLEAQQATMKELDEKLDEVKLDVREIKTKVAVRASIIGAIIPTMAFIIAKLLEIIPV